MGTMAKFVVPMKGLPTETQLAPLSSQDCLSPYANAQPAGTPYMLRTTPHMLGGGPQGWLSWNCMSTRWHGVRTHQRGSTPHLRSAERTSV